MRFWMVGHFVMNNFELHQSGEENMALQGSPERFRSRPRANGFDVSLPSNRGFRRYYLTTRCKIQALIVNLEPPTHHIVSSIANWKFHRVIPLR